jgi:hypothetical protein
MKNNLVGPCLQKYTYGWRHLFFRSLLIFLFHSFQAHSGQIKFSERLQPYYSYYVNKKFWTKAAKEHKLLYAAAIKEVDIHWKCPGDSMLVGFGMHAISDGSHLYKFTCSFLENPKKELTKKKECPEVKEAKVAPGTSGKMECAANTWAEGFYSKYDSEKKTRGENLLCCAMEDWAKKPIKKAQCVSKKQVNTAGKNFNFLCPKESVITSIESHFKPGSPTIPNGYEYDVECCLLVE